MARKFVFAVIILLSVFSACKKTDDVTIKGNVPPPDHTIDSSTMVIYIGKSYINMLGRKPVGNEQNEALAILRANNFSADNRKQFIQSLFSKTEYYPNLYVAANNQYLRNVDSATIAGQLFQFNYLLGQPGYASIYSYLHFEINRLDTLQQVVNYMSAGILDYRGMLMRLANNYFYDQINMGTENFVVSTFQN
ncbi:MAG TPA: hypothetical protein VG603_03885, partial [Chitinophagales bacterium]|nr:hypothetical protein [Chitinophagales bacterium]